MAPHRLPGVFQPLIGWNVRAASTASIERFIPYFRSTWNIHSVKGGFSENYDA